jgi:site-specific recombinase XerC
MQQAGRLGYGEMLLSDDDNFFEMSDITTNVQKLLGHSNIAVTQVYSHLQPEHLHDTVNKITVSLN